MTTLPLHFFERDTVTVARQLLGKKLTRTLNNEPLSGVITETEAYRGESDSASHASKGLTPRTATMFGPPGRAYVYLIYGMYHMFNVVTEPQAQAGAVLIRALWPLQGATTMQAHRGNVAAKKLSDGPGKLCQALAIDRTLNGYDLTLGETIWLSDYQTIADEDVITGPRVGIGYANPVDQAAPWRFTVKQNTHHLHPSSRIELS